MVVRNQATTLRESLRSVRPFIGHWKICNAGSADGIRGVIAESLAGIPGTLHESKWVSPGHNLGEALALAKGKADYHFLAEADIVIEVESEFRDKLEADSYLILEKGPLESWAERLVSDAHEWRFSRGARPFIRSRTGRSRDKLSGARIWRNGSAMVQRAELAEEIELLKAEFERGANVARCAFHLGESYRELGNLPLGIEWHEKRSTMAGWDEETWYSIYQVARLQERLGISWILVLNQYLRAYQFRSARAEPLYCIARFYRESGQHHLAYLFSSQGCGVPYPDDLLLVDRGIYEYLLPLEHALCCHELGKSDEAAQAATRVLASAATPAEIRAAAEGLLGRASQGGQSDGTTAGAAQPMFRSSS